MVQKTERKKFVLHTNDTDNASNWTNVDISLFSDMYLQNVIYFTFYSGVQHNLLTGQSRIDVCFGIVRL